MRTSKITSFGSDGYFARRVFAGGLIESANFAEADILAAGCLDRPALVAAGSTVSAVGGGSVPRMCIIELNGERK